MTEPNRPSDERLLAALMGEVELEEEEKISIDEAMGLIRAMGTRGLTVDEAVKGIESICIAAHEAGIPQLIQAELRAREVARRGAFWRSAGSLIVGGVVLLILMIFILGVAGL